MTGVEPKWLNRHEQKGPSKWVQVYPIWSHLSYPQRKANGLTQVYDPERGEYPVMTTDLKTYKPQEKKR